MTRDLLWAAGLMGAQLLLSAAIMGAAERTAALPVYGMDCPMCARGLEGSLKSLPGVKSAVVSVENAEAVVVYEDREVTAERLARRIEENGFSTKAKKPAQEAPRQKKGKSNDKSL